ISSTGGSGWRRVAPASKKTARIAANSRWTLALSFIGHRPDADHEESEAQHPRAEHPRPFLQARRVILEEDPVRSGGKTHAAKRPVGKEDVRFLPVHPRAPPLFPRVEEHENALGRGGRREPDTPRPAGEQMHLSGRFVRPRRIERSRLLDDGGAARIKRGVNDRREDALGREENRRGNEESTRKRGHRAKYEVGRKPLPGRTGGRKHDETRVRESRDTPVRTREENRRPREGRDPAVHGFQAESHSESEDQRVVAPRGVYLRGVGVRGQDDLLGERPEAAREPRFVPAEPAPQLFHDVRLDGIQSASGGRSGAKRVPGEVCREKENVGSTRKGRTGKPRKEARQNERRTERDGKRPRNEVSRRNTEPAYQRQLRDEAIGTRLAEGEDETDGAAEEKRGEEAAAKGRVAAQGERDSKNEEDPRGHARIGRGFGPARPSIDGKKDHVEAGPQADRTDVALGAGETRGARHLGVEGRGGQKRRRPQSQREERREGEVGRGSSPARRLQEKRRRGRAEQRRCRQQRLRAGSEDRERPGPGREDHSRPPPAPRDPGDAEQNQRKKSRHGDGVWPDRALEQARRQHPRDAPEERRDAVCPELLQKQKRREARQPEMEQREEIRQPMHGRSGQEQRDRQRVEDRDFLREEKRMAAELSVDPEWALAGPERPLRHVPDRQGLVTQVQVEERAFSRSDGPERGQSEEREQESGEEPAGSVRGNGFRVQVSRLLDIKPET